MKRFLISAVITAISLTTAAFATDVGVSINVGQPGFFGQLNIGDFQQPSVIYSQPVIVDRGISMNQEPTYLHVPPTHYKNWSKYCHKYNACNKKVYFVHDNWYQDEYVPRYKEKHQDRRDEYNDGRDDSQDDRHDNKHGKDHGDKGHGDHH